jgi:hypothetical protein
MDYCYTTEMYHFNGASNSSDSFSVGDSYSEPKNSGSEVSGDARGRYQGPDAVPGKLLTVDRQFDNCLTPKVRN